jgi:hypothetical protein
MPKVIKSKTKIPTPIGLILLIVALFLGIFLYFYQDSKSQQKRAFLSPKNIAVINLTDTSATVTWTTDLEVQGEVILSQVAERFIDDRDKALSKNRTTHFVTLSRLTPQTKYTFTIKDAGEEFFDENLQSFQTAQVQDKQSLKNSEEGLKLQPLTGVVVDETLEPVEGALIYLNLPGASKVGTYTNSEGNFILPIKYLLIEDLSGIYHIEQNSTPTLLISKDNKFSIVEFTLPLKSSSFETLTLGRNINLRQYLTLSEEVAKNQEMQLPSKEISYDLNGDGKINSIDLSIVVQSFGKRFDNRQLDFNSDGVVDQKDIELFIKAVPNSASP